MSGHNFPVSSSTSVVLDMQCYKDNRNHFIVKEVSVIEVVSGKLLLHHIAQPPYNRDVLSEDKLKESYWLYNHFHGLDWNTGDIPYNMLLCKLRECLSKRTLVYVKGTEKKEFVNKHLVLPVASAPLVVDMSNVGCDSLQRIGNLLSSNVLRCGYHKRVDHRCALSNCILLRDWLLLTAKEPPARPPSVLCPPSVYTRLPPLYPSGKTEEEEEEEEEGEEEEKTGRDEVDSR